MTGTDSIMKLEEARWRRAEADMGADDVAVGPPAFITQIKVRLKLLKNGKNVSFHDFFCRTSQCPRVSRPTSTAA